MDENMNLSDYPEATLTAPWLELRKYRVALAASLGLSYDDAAILGWDRVLSCVCDVTHISIK